MLERMVTSVPIVDVKQLSTGSKLAEEVHTALGGLLFSKGTALYEKDIEYLNAFMIKQVTIEEQEEATGIEPSVQKEAVQQEVAAAKARKDRTDRPEAFQQSF
ncbi:hypothetical protein EDM59_30780, partial [Brevibacillus nitrificans]